MSCTDKYGDIIRAVPEGAASLFFIMNTETIELQDSAKSLFDDSGEDRSLPEKDTVTGEEPVRSLLLRGKPENSSRYFLKTEASLIQLAYAHNKILSLSNSRTSILAHQVESTHRIVNSLKKRFLIADEVGLGKTIEAGLVLKELVYRYGYKRILIVCPASLILQWQHELSSKFNESFVFMDRRLHEQIRGKDSGVNPWKKVNRVICSLDFIKNSDFSGDLKKTSWDVVIVDEAHRLRRDSKHATQAYAVGELLSRQSSALLLLSATPFRGNLEELYYLVSLVDRNLLGPFNTYYRNYCLENGDLAQLKRKLSQVVIRRTKKEVGGFTLRHARTVKFDLYPEERLLYDATTQYVVEEFNRAMQLENRAVGFVMTIFQKLLDSSSRALCQALIKRKERLTALVERVQARELITREIRTCLDEETYDDGSVDAVIGETVAKTVHELSEEISTLCRLIGIAGMIEHDKKGQKLKELLSALKKQGNGKFLIFTQFRTTQDYLSELLDGYSVEIFNGSMDRYEKEKALERFKNRSEVLIATEAGGEGRNMQFCNILVNYDLPWSPLKIEQRIGRIHRFGQKKDVYIYNFSTRETVAERVLEVLTHKLKLFEGSIGAPDVLLGEIEDELKLSKLFMEMAAGRRDRKSMDSEVDARVVNARKSYEKLAELTVAERMDFNYDEYYRITLKERQFSNKRIESFVQLLQETDNTAYGYMGKKNQSGYYPVKQGGFPGYEFFPKGTFDSQKALENEHVEFLACGHPIVDLFLERCKEQEFGGNFGIIKIDHGKNFYGMAFNYIAEYHSITRSSELLTVVIEQEGALTEYERQELEHELFACGYRGPVDLEPHAPFMESLAAHADRYIDDARERAQCCVRNRIDDMALALDCDIYPEMEKIRASYDGKIKEIEEKLSIQEGKMKWHGSDMKGAITRTVKQIQQAKNEKDMLLTRYHSYLGITCKLHLLNAAVLISTA